MLAIVSTTSADGLNARRDDSAEDALGAFAATTSGESFGASGIGPDRASWDSSGRDGLRNATSAGNGALRDASRRRSTSGLKESPRSLWIPLSDHHAAAQMSAPSIAANANRDRMSAACPGATIERRLVTAWAGGTHHAWRSGVRDIDEHIYAAPMSKAEHSSRQVCRSPAAGRIYGQSPCLSSTVFGQVPAVVVIVIDFVIQLRRLFPRSPRKHRKTVSIVLLEDDANDA
jgi:hypothetical protein